MARHDLPDDGTEHTLSPACQCAPTTEERDGRTVWVHTGAGDGAQDYDTAGGEHDPLP